MTTTDDVAQALVLLTAAIANDGQAEAVTIPIMLAHSGEAGDAELVIGVGNDVLSAPTGWDGEEPDFSSGAEALRSHRSFPRQPYPREDDGNDDPSPSAAHWDLEFGGFTG